jgi:predicted flap endonuclease-1-like 5' DNA nuclease
MERLTDFIDQLPNYTGIFVLMLSTFLIGYFSAWGMQRAKYVKMLRKIKKKPNITNKTDETKDIDIIFTEIKPKIIEVVKEAQEELELQKEIEETVDVKSPKEIAEKARTSYISYTHNKPQLNFDHFGYADTGNSEDLTKINGIGPYIEQKLNEIGIYNYEQISRFKDEDIRVLTDLIDFFPGRIERDDWVGQAEELND